MLRAPYATERLTRMELQPLPCPQGQGDVEPCFYIEKLSVRFSKAFEVTAWSIIESDDDDHANFMTICLHWSSLVPTGFVQVRKVTLSKPIDDPSELFPEVE